MTSKNVEALCAFVTAKLASEPYVLDGFKWCAVPQKDICVELKISVETLRRMIKRPPFVRERVLVDGVVTSLLREGDATAMTPRHMARILEKIWREMAAIPTNKTHFGLFTGLAKDWPEGFQPQLLRYVLADWQRFMSVVGWHIDLENIEADVDGMPAKLAKRYYKFPSLLVIRRFWQPAIEGYMVDLQEHQSPTYSAFMKVIGAKPKSNHG